MTETAISAEMMKELQKLLAGNRLQKGRAKPTPEVTAQRKANNDAECIKVFTAAGYADVQPRVNVLTYGKVKTDGTVTGWLAKGRKVRAGEKSLQVGPFKLFHITQTDEIIPAEVH